MSTTPYARLLVSLNGGAAAAGGIEAAASDDVDYVYESTIGWPSSPAPYLEIYEAPVGWSPVPSTGWIATAGGGWKYYGTTPPPTIAAPDAAHFGKVAAQLVVGGGLKDGALSTDMTSGATVLVRSASVGLESVAHRETTEFDEVRAWIGAVQRDLRLLETALAAVGALTEAQLRAVSATLTAALPVNSQKITGLANGSNAQDALAFNQLATAINAAVSGTTGAVPRIASANTLGTGSMTDDGAGVVTLTSAAALLDLVRTALGTTKAHDLALRNTTAGVSPGATVQVAPSVLFEGHAWTTADKTMRVRISVVPRTSTNVDFIVEYDTGSGSYSEAFRYTTSTTGSFVGAVQCYGYASNAGGYIHDPSGSGLFFGGSGAAQLKSYDSGNPLLLRSDQGITTELVAAGIQRVEHGTAGVNRTDKTKKVVTTTTATTTNIWTYTSMPDNAALVVEFRGYCYNTADPGMRIYFAKRACFNRNGGAPTPDSAVDIFADVVVGVWGAPVTMAITAGAPTTNDVSIQATTPALNIKHILQQVKVYLCTTSA